MRAFINYIITFIYDAIHEIYYNINTYVNTNTNKANVIGLSTSYFNIWLDKSIISGDLITIGITWRELILYGLIIFLIVFFIVFFVRFILKLFGLFRIW